MTEKKTISLEQLSKQVAENLSSSWDHYKAGRFAEHLKQIYGVCPDQEPVFQCLYIIESENGDLKYGPGGVTKHRWQVDDSGLREMSTKLKWNYDGSPYYLTPRIKFYLENTGVSIVDAYGPRLTFGRRGQITRIDSGIAITSVEILN